MSVIIAHKVPKLVAAVVSEEEKACSPLLPTQMQCIHAHPSTDFHARLPQPLKKERLTIF